MSAFQGCCILIVEDEYLVAQEISEFLAELGAEIVGPAGSVKEALAVIQRGPDMDAAILDVNLGGDRIYPVADALVERDVPFIFATGYDEPAIPKRYAKVSICQKPVDKTRIADWLEQVTSRDRGSMGVSRDK
jgi:CheY-like chemotaxis protein